MKEKITVHKLNAGGREVWRYEGVVLKRTDTSILLEAYYDLEDIDYHGLQLRRGDRFIETFFSDRWYNIFAIYDVDDDHFKGWYCNIARPALIEDRDIYAEDLALDLIVTPDGKHVLLDEDEFAALKLPPDERKRALETTEKLKGLATAKAAPFNYPSDDL